MPSYPISSKSLGHNHPPSDIALSRLPIIEQELSDFLRDHPTILTDSDALAGKHVVQFAAGVLAEAEIERSASVRPLNDTVKGINARYKTARETPEKLLDALKARLNVYLDAERQRREEEAARIAAELAEKERLAREAEARETEALENAAVGECVDLGEIVKEADQAFDAYKRTKNEAARAEREAGRVGIAGSGRRLSQRTQETLSLENAALALADIMAAGNGAVPPKVSEAILSAARDFRRIAGRLPAGVKQSVTRSL